MGHYTMTNINLMFTWKALLNVVNLRRNTHKKYCSSNVNKVNSGARELSNENKKNPFLKNVILKYEKITNGFNEVKANNRIC